MNFALLGRSDHAAAFGLAMFWRPGLFNLRSVRSARLRVRARRVSVAVCLGIVGAWTPLLVFDPLALVAGPSGSHAPPLVTVVEPQPGHTRMDLRLGFPIAGVRGHHESVAGSVAPITDSGFGRRSAFLRPGQGLFVLWLDAVFWFLIGWVAAGVAPAAWVRIAHPYAVVAASFTVVFALGWLQIWRLVFVD